MQNSFQLISDPSEKAKLLTDLVRSRGRIQLKTIEAESTIVFAEPIFFRGSVMQIQLFKNSRLGKSSGQVIVQFQMGEQKYICQVNFVADQELVSLGMEKKIFRVQRREFFRLRLPINFRGVLFINKVDEKILNREFSLIDIGGGGCRIGVPESELLLISGAKFLGELRIPKKSLMPVSGVIRYQVAIDSRPRVISLGIQFENLVEAQKDRLAALVMDLYRELFVRTE